STFPRPSRSARVQDMTTELAQAADPFVPTWNKLHRRDRARIRRTVRIGRPLAGEEEAIGIAYAQFQRTRLWNRLFWAWFPLGLILALKIAISIHPLIIGVVLALAAQAVS